MKRWTRRPEGSTWGDFGPDDEIGRLNLLTEACAGRARSARRQGFCLSLPLDLPGGNVLNPRRHPPALAPTRRDGQPYLNFQMSRLQEGAVDVLSDDQATLSLQYSTQWDGLSHVGALFDVQGDGQARRVYYGCRRRGRAGRRRSWRRCLLPPLGMRAGSASAATRKRHAGPWRAAGPGARLRHRPHAGRPGAARPRCTNSGSRWNPATCGAATGFAEALVQMDGKPTRIAWNRRARCWTAPTPHCWTGSPTAAWPRSAPTTTRSRPTPRARPAPAIRSCRCIITACSSWAPLAELWYLKDLADWLHAQGRNRFCSPRRRCGPRRLAGDADRHRLIPSFEPSPADFAPSATAPVESFQ